MAESPDLTALPSPPLHPQHQQYRGSFSLPSSAAAYHPPGASLHQDPEQLQLTSPQQQHPPASSYVPGLSSPGAASQSTQQPYLPPVARRRTFPDPDDEYQPDDMGRPKRTKTEADDTGGASSVPLAGSGEGVEVRTKFPVARIKRIMQADEDVGKVAQVTPVVVSKALELFMISLVTKSANEARERSSKRVTAAHLKQAVLKDQQFDFLSEIVSKVPDAPAPREQADGAVEGDGRKRRAGGRRKKKDSSDDEMM